MKTYCTLLIFFCSFKLTKAQHYIFASSSISTNRGWALNSFFNFDKTYNKFKTGGGINLAYAYKKDSSNTHFQLNLNYNYCPIYLFYNNRIDYATESIIGNFNFHFVGLQANNYWKLINTPKNNLYFGVGVTANIKVSEKSTATGYVYVRHSNLPRNSWTTTNQHSTKIVPCFLGYNIALKYEHVLSHNYNLVLCNQYQWLYNLRGVNIFSSSINLGLSYKIK